MSIKLADTLAPMADFPAALAEHINFSDGKSLQEKYNLGELGGEGGAGHIELTQAEYDALSDEEKMNGTIYFITDATSGSDDVELIEYAYSIVEPAGSFSIYYSYEDLSTKIGCYVPVTTYNRKYGEWVVNIYVVRQNDEGDIEIINENGYETIIHPMGEGTVATLPFIKDTRASSQTTWSSKQIASALLGDDQLNEFSNNSVQNWVLAGKFKEIEDKLDENIITLTQAEYNALTDEEKDSDTVYFISDAKEEPIKQDDSAYMPDMYDRNANGDMPVVPFDRLAYSMCLIQNTNLLNNGDTYDEDYVGGWVYTMANDILIKDKEMFNKIKVIVSIPGVLRIGIVNDKIFEANPRYSNCLVKWLVADFVAYTGLKEYDIEDTILEEGQYVFIECRQGESSWYYNQGSTDVTQGKVTYPAQSCTSGLNVADKLDSTTHNTVFKSQSVTSKSAIFTFSGEINVGSKLRTNFLARGYDNTARTDMSDIKTYTQTLFKGGLNVGLYRRTKYSDTRLGKCVENLMNTTYTGNNTARRAYAPAHQESLVGKSVYAFKMDVHTPGNLTIYHVKGKTVDTFEIIDKYTHYVRAKGLQTIHLPFDIKLKSEDEYIAFGGLHYKSTSSNIVFSECKWLYGVVPNWMKMGHNNGYIHLNFDTKSYPEVITEIGDYSNNTNTLNVELICRGEKRSPLEDKYISFTGDSITTYANFITTQAGVPAGNTAGDNASYYPASGRTVNNIDATWWGILARDNRMQILRNDAWSGSRVSSTTGSSDTKCLCGTERYKFLENGSQGTDVTYPFGEPEIIINMIGTNDLSGNVALGEGILYGLSSPTEDDYKKIYNAYSLMCQRFAGYYNRQGAKVVHFILPRGTGLNTYANSNGDSIPKVALEFEKIAKSWGQYFIPLSYFTGFNMANYKALTCPTSNVLRDFRSSSFNGSDGLHPNVIGMETVADGVDRFLKEII